MRYGVDGVTVEIRLPVPERELPEAAIRAAIASRSAASLQQPQERPSGLAGKRVLLIEDEPLISLDLEMILSGAGCEVVGSVVLAASLR